MGVNEIDFANLSAAKGLSRGLQAGAQLGNMYRQNRLQDSELERRDLLEAQQAEQKENQRVIDDMARDAGVALEIQDPAELQAFLQRRVDRIKANGGDPSDTLAIMGLPPAQLRQELQRVYQKAMPASSLAKNALGNKKFIGTPQRVKEGDKSFLVGLVQKPNGNISEERVEIGGEFISTDGLTAEERVTQKRKESGASEQGKLEQRIKLEPELVKRIAAVKQQVASFGNIKKEDRSNARALETYEMGVKNLADALGKTSTGPMSGWLPALTADAQSAEGAIAVMAPIMKSIFRGAGEGTFTDSDQKMLMGMLPTRQDLPEARAAKMQAIDMIVRSKLGSSAEPETLEPEENSNNVDDLVNKYAN